MSTVGREGLYKMINDKIWGNIYAYGCEYDFELVGLRIEGFKIEVIRYVLGCFIMSLFYF